MEKEYDKACSQYTSEVKKAEKEMDKWASKARKLAADGLTTANLASVRWRRRLGADWGHRTSFVLASVYFLVS